MEKTFKTADQDNYIPYECDLIHLRRWLVSSAMDTNYQDQPGAAPLSRTSSPHVHCAGNERDDTILLGRRYASTIRD